MLPALLITSLVAVVFLLVYFQLKRRLGELKSRTDFAVKADELVKVEMSGEDVVSQVARNFNLLGEKLSSYKGINVRLSGIEEEKQKADQKLKSFEESLSQMNFLTEIGRQLTSSLTVDEIALRFYKNINSSMIADEVFILLERNDRKHYFHVSNNQLHDIGDNPWTRDPDNLLNWCSENGRELFLNNASKDYAQYVFKVPQMLNGKVIESVIGVPLSLSNLKIGAVLVTCAEKDQFSNYHMDFVRSMASYVSVAISNANLYSELDQEKEKSETLLLNILPRNVAEEIKSTGKTEARQFDKVSVMFTDFVGFTSISEKMSPKQLVQEIDKYFSAFDVIVKRNGLEKIKTIGDAYLAVSGLPVEDPRHAEKMIKAAREMLDYLKDNNSRFEMRVGVNSGPVVAGVVGSDKYAYDIWGDTVNTASRMESNGVAGEINVSESTYQLIKDKHQCEFRGEMEAKGKGKIPMYLVK